MRRAAGQIVELPEVRLLAHPNVECAIHPGKAIAGVAVCCHVLEGAAVYLKQEPDRDRWGSVLCEACTFSCLTYVNMRVACEKCARYHFAGESDHQGDVVTDLEIMAKAETEGLRQYRQIRDGKLRTARNPFESFLAREAWNLGFRLGRHLDEAKEIFREPVTQ